MQPFSLPYSSSQFDNHRKGEEEVLQTCSNIRWQSSVDRAIDVDFLIIDNIISPPKFSTTFRIHYIITNDWHAGPGTILSLMIGHYQPVVTIVNNIEPQTASQLATITIMTVVNTQM